jgi:uncharacterized protein involved in copper resistance
MDTSSFRSIGFAPLSCAILGGVLTLGTVVGQSGPAAEQVAASSPMAGMDHSAMGGMNHAMPGMDHSAPGMDSSPMPGMGAPPAADAPMDDMDMSAPGMAASMPGGFHADCATRTTCTVRFAKGATGTAAVLGVKARLHSLTSSTARLLIDGSPLVVHRGKAVRHHRLTVSASRGGPTETTITFRKGS